MTDRFPIGRSPERRRSIVDAALRLALRHGPRATTMEAIAREAGVAKPTLYGYFGDKSAVFEAVALFFVEEVERAVGTAAAGESDPVAHVGTILSAKYRTVARLIGQSVHADELRDFGRMIEPLARLERRIEAQVEAQLAAAGVARPLALARLVIAAADGVSRKASNVAEIGPAIRLLAERLLRPEVAGAGDRAG